jgi:hypothetical protein
MMDDRQISGGKGSRVAQPKNDGDIMKSFFRITLIVGLAALGNTASVSAQPSDRFHRVTTAAQQDLRATYTRDMNNRAGSTRDLRSASNVSRVALASRGLAARSSAAESRVFDHYTARSEAELQDRGANGGRFSTWRNEPEPVALEAAPPPRSHNYYPGLRSGVGVTPPVTLTATSNMLYPRTCCSASRSQAMAGAGHMASAGMMHHR